MNFVFVSLQRIGTDRESTSTNLARELARQQHNVLYVNSPVDRKAYFSSNPDPFVAAHIRAIKTKQPPLQKISSHLWVLHPVRPLESFNWLPSTRLFSWLIRINNHRLAQDIKAAVQELAFGDFILVNDKDIFRSFYLKELLRPKKYVYLDRDYTVGMPYWQRHGVGLEPVLMRKADAVFCNSLDYTARARRYNPNSFYIGNGYNAQQFGQALADSMPVDLAAVPGPRIGYVGALITLRLDLALLVAMAQARPQWSFVLIGWEDEEFAKSDLHTLPNVFFLGRKHYQTVQNYINFFDVCINPQLLNEITRGNFPLKILEYLALGKPVVATTTNTMTEVFSEHTYLADGTANYLNRIEEALGTDTFQKTQARLDFVKQFSWENMAGLFIKHLQAI